ncbi:recombinase family protein [Anaeromassilibacillus senegalensis]|uniref:recombinase family protein n=1 Tax=Anaeromassilibacillus senegalensis TaxID=1673717 RepID=UPI000681192F|nr:recombinase family protein [Anaeromassilibacillus senegalensis]
MRKKAAIYIRVSTLDQAREGYSLSAQERALRKWCEDHGYGVYFVYADEGISGKDIEHRPGMKRLLKDIENKCFNLVVVWSLSRFTRSVADLYDTLGVLQKCSITFVSLTESFDTGTAMGRAMVGVCGVFAQLERELTAERVSAAMGERAAQGKRTCHDVLGYDLDGKDSLRINEREAERVRYVFKKYLEYKNLSAVAELCRLKGYTGKRGKVQTAESVRKILTRPIYAGYNSYRGKIYKGNHPAIISVESYNKVQHILGKSVAGRRLQRPYEKLNTKI